MNFATKLAAVAGSASAAAAIFWAANQQQQQHSMSTSADQANTTVYNAELLDAHYTKYEMSDKDTRLWEYISGATLASWIKQGREGTYAVVDVRDTDLKRKRTGKKMILNAINIPARAVRADPTALVAQLKENDTVIFHCMYSQQRGPGSAQTYAKARRNAESSGSDSSSSPFDLVDNIL